MKKIEAIIRQDKLEDVKDELQKINISGITIYQVMGCGKQKGWKEILRGKTTMLNILPKVKIEIVIAEEEMTEKIIKAITVAAFTGQIGDGKIFVYDVEKAVRIRTGEEGICAV